MGEYKAHISVSIDTKPLDEFESRIKALNDQKIDVKLSLNDSGLDNIKRTYENIGKNIGKGVERGSSTYLSSIEKRIKNFNFDSALSSMNSKLDKYNGQDSKWLQSARSAIREYENELNNLQKHFDTNDAFSLNDEELVSSFNRMENAAQQFGNAMKIVGTETSKSLGLGEGARLSNEIETYLKNNTKAAKEYGVALEQLASDARKATTVGEKSDITSQFRNLKSEISAKGLTGKSIFDEFKRGFEQIGQFATTYGIIDRAIDGVISSIGELKEIDTILTEISKTSDMTSSELKTLGETAFDSASEWGKSASDYLTGVQEMSRSGFYGEQGEQMARLSILAQAAGDLTPEMANDYLLASNAAYQYAGNVEKLNALLDGQNMITNRNAVSMEDMSAATTRAASMASELNVGEQQLSAVIGTVAARTRASGDEIGNAIKSVLINVTNVQNAKIAKTFEEAGVAQTEFVNGVEQMRNPIDILEDLAEVFNSLSESDPLRNDILMNIGQKYQANKLSALLSGWSDYEKMLQDYAEGEGSAAEEANFCLVA